eukprot:753472-Pyramimonas_sp.AAC.1
MVRVSCRVDLGDGLFSSSRDFLEAGRREGPPPGHANTLGPAGYAHAWPAGAEVQGYRECQ